MRVANVLVADVVVWAAHVRSGSASDCAERGMTTDDFDNGAQLPRNARCSVEGDCTISSPSESAQVTAGEHIDGRPT